MPALINHGLDLTKFENRKALLLSDFKYFLLTFFELKNGYPFVWSEPVGRKSHFDIICDELMDVYLGKTLRLLINVPPGFAKSTILVYFIAWTIAKHPESNNLYISYSFDLAEGHTATIKEIIEMPAYRQYFEVKLRRDSNSRSNFKTEQFGVTVALGSQGSVTGLNAGRPHVKGWSGCEVIDDPIKPDDGFSETVCQSVRRNYNGTLKKRVRGANVPIIFLGQRIGENDLAQFLIDGQDGGNWKLVVLEDLDEHDQPLYPEYYGKLTPEEELTYSPELKKQTIVQRAKEWLHNERKFNEYVYWAQHQQQPQPLGGGIFKINDFRLLDAEPEIISTFITIDTAESTKDWADYTAMSFWGLYKIITRGVDLGVYGLHWIHAIQERIEPRELEATFFDFYGTCQRYPVKPDACYIEKKSTGVTLISTLQKAPGLLVIDVDRGPTSGSKVARFYGMQPFVAKGQFSLPRNGKHTQLCLEHMRKIVGTMTHAHDDLADTAQMAAQCALIDKILLPSVVDKQQEKLLVMANQQMQAIEHLRSKI